MLTIEIRVNGAPVETVYAQNLDAGHDGETVYGYSWSRHDLTTPKIEGRVAHIRHDGITKLAEKILGDVGSKLGRSIKKSQ